MKAAVAAGETIYVVEGETDVHSLQALGLTATCNPMGAGKWSKVNPSPLYGAGKVVIVADRDKRDAQHASDVWTSLKWHVGTLEVVQARPGKDAADHIAAGLDVADFAPVDPVDAAPLAGRTLSGPTGEREGVFDEPAGPSREAYTPEDVKRWPVRNPRALLTIPSFS